MSKFTEKDLEILDRTTNVRERLLHELTKGQLPTDSEGVRTIRDLVDSMDKAVFSKAKINVDDKKNELDAQQKMMFQELVKHITGNMTSAPPIQESASVPVFDTDMDFKLEDGETMLGKDDIDPTPYIEEL